MLYFLFHIAKVILLFGWCKKITLKDIKKYIILEIFHGFRFKEANGFSRGRN